MGYISLFLFTLEVSARKKKKKNPIVEKFSGKTLSEIHG